MDKVFACAFLYQRACFAGLWHARFNAQSRRVEDKSMQLMACASDDHRMPVTLQRCLENGWLLLIEVCGGEPTTSVEYSLLEI